MESEALADGGRKMTARRNRKAVTASDDYEDSEQVYQSFHCAECSIDCDCVRFGFVQPFGGGEPRKQCLDCGRQAE